jgi:threonine dehydratase
MRFFSTVIGVESERCASFSSALKIGQPIYTKAESTLADGLAVPRVGINSLATAAPLVDKCVVVKEEYIAMAILRSITELLFKKGKSNSFSHNELKRLDTYLDWWRLKKLWSKELEPAD